MRQFKLVIVSALTFASAAASAEMMDRPQGIRFFEGRLTLTPYVSVSASYDSKSGASRYSGEDVIWTVNPSLGFTYKSEAWDVSGQVFYQFNAYSKNQTTNEQSYHGFGENLNVKWSNAPAGERGWGLMLAERLMKTNQLDDMNDNEGRSYNRDRLEFNVSGGLQRRFASKLHADVNASYYYLDYDNDNNQHSTSALYGWKRLMGGIELGWAPSPWTDILVCGSYQSYNQDNRNNNAYYNHPEYKYSGNSEGWTLQIGLGSYATDRIKYRVLGGWSTYQYEEGGSDSSGFTYSVSGSYDINETWKTMLFASSYYQPSEREFGSSQRVDTLSWGIAHEMVQGKLSATFDVAYRREGREHQAVNRYDYDLDILTFRLGLSYMLNRFVSITGGAEYRASLTEGDSKYGSTYDYDRFRGTLGLRFTY